MKARLIAMKCKLRMCCLVKNAPLPKACYPLRKGQKNINENTKTFLQGAGDYSSWFSFLRNPVALKDLSLTLRSGEESTVHCSKV